MPCLDVKWVSQETVGDCQNPEEPECNGSVWRFTFTNGRIADICRDCDYTKIIKKRGN